MSKLISPFLAGVRSLRTKPGYAFVCVIVLGTSSAALMTMISVVDALLMRLPSARNPQEIVYIDTGVGARHSRPTYLDLAERNTVFSGLFAHGWPAEVGLDVGKLHRDVNCMAVTGNFFPTMGEVAVKGRLLEPADDVTGAEPVAVVSAQLQRTLDLKLGDLLEINRHPFRLVGIMPENHVSVSRDRAPDMWIPLVQVPVHLPDWILDNRNYSWLRVGGRLRTGLAPGEAQAEANVLAAQIEKEHPEMYSTLKYSLVSFPELRFAQDGRSRMMVVLGGTVAALFVLAFTNFFALTLLRLLSRRREIAVRMAVGATRGTIARWLLGELSAVLVLGLAIGGAISVGLLRLARMDPRIAEMFAGAGIRFDESSAAAVAALSLIALGTIWLMLNLQVGSDRLTEALKESAMAPRRHRAFTVLLATQVALALFLLAMSVTFLGTLRDIVSRALPFSTERVLLLDADTRSFGWLNDRARGHRFYRNLIDQVRNVPGVIAVGACDSRLQGGARSTGVDVDGEAGSGVRVSYTYISPGYFEAMGIRFQEGQSLTEDEFVGNRPVAVINRAMARRIWPTQASVVGLTFQPWANAPRTTVVGIVDDVPTRLEDSPLPHLYLPFTIDTVGWLNIAIAVQDDSAAMRRAIKTAVAGIWENSSPPEPYAVSQQVLRSRADLVASTRVITWVAVFAMAIAAFGLYSFSAFTAAQSVRDMAVRQALGARFLHLARSHLARYRWGLLGGLTGGLALAVASGPVLKHLDITLQPPGASTVVVAACVLAVIALCGLCMPLLHMRRVDIRNILSSE